MDDEYFFGELLDEIAYDLYEKSYFDLSIDAKMRVLSHAGEVIDAESLA